MIRSRNARLRVSAFTRVELLVVLGSALLVASLLAPVVGCGDSTGPLRRLSAERTCLANLRSLSMGVFMYANANDGFIANTYYPHAAPAAEPSNIGNVLATYAPYVEHPDLWRCPMHEKPLAVSGAALGGTPYAGATVEPSYGFNWYIAAAALETPATSPRAYGWTRHSDIASPQLKLMIMDRSAYSVTGKEPGAIEHVKVHDPAYWPEPRHGRQAIYESANIAAEKAPPAYYEGTFYAARADGGVETVRADSQNLFDGQWKRHWFTGAPADINYTNPSAEAPRTVTYR